ncbi:MAG: ABC transporter ATP-binding protein [Chloroflexi bacterium]|nr:ABC transporter ATP-binding protein [Chloroflexota bacterium]
MAPAALEVRQVIKRFGAVTAVDGVSFSLANGELVSLLGPSGCGKSTLLRMIAGIERPDAGEISIGGSLVNAPGRGVSVPPERRGLGMVFQNYALWPHMTVRDNLAYPLQCRRVGGEERRKRIAEALRAVQLEGYEARYPGQLSGGQQQRVALARALVAEPRVILLDEPLSNLDARLRDEMRGEIKRLHVQLGLSMLYVTHDQAEALALSDRIVVMEAGKVIQEDSPEALYSAPASASVARFLGASNSLYGVYAGDGRVELPSGGMLRSAMDPHCVQGEQVTVVVRPDGFRAAVPGEAGLMATILRASFLGNGFEHVVELNAGEELIVRTTERLGGQGSNVALMIDERTAYAFPRA